MFGDLWRIEDGKALSRAALRKEGPAGFEPLESVGREGTTLVLLLGSVNIQPKLPRLAPRVQLSLRLHSSTTLVPHQHDQQHPQPSCPRSFFDRLVPPLLLSVEELESSTVY